MPIVTDQLREARAAYHALQTGMAVATVVDSSGERVEYSTSTAPRLAAYIRELETQLNGDCPRRILPISTSKGLT
jgi:N-formylglutamate amidohydrolase